MTVERICLICHKVIKPGNKRPKLYCQGHKERTVKDGDT